MLWKSGQRGFNHPPLGRERQGKSLVVVES
jgi:hypothetical protein